MLSISLSLLSFLFIFSIRCRCKIFSLRHFDAVGRGAWEITLFRLLIAFISPATFRCISDYHFDYFSSRRRFLDELLMYIFAPEFSDYRLFRHFFAFQHFFLSSAEVKPPWWYYFAIFDSSFFFFHFSSDYCFFFLDFRFLLPFLLSLLFISIDDYFDYFFAFLFFSRNESAHFDTIFDWWPAIKAKVAWECVRERLCADFLRSLLSRHYQKYFLRHFSSSPRRKFFFQNHFLFFIANFTSSRYAV